jgi:hypothetical protein
MKPPPRVKPVAHAEPGFALHLTAAEGAAASRLATSSAKGVCPRLEGAVARVVKAPRRPDSDGEPGDRAVSGGYIYFCVERRKWRRAPLI